MKNKSYKLFSLLIVLIITSCNGQSNKSTASKTNNSKSIASNYIEGKDYLEFKRARVMDTKGFSKPVEAYSILIPNQWKLESDIMWNPPGTTCAGNNLSIKAMSPDGNYSFEFLPNSLWTYFTDQQLGEFTQRQQYPEYCSYGEPMNAMDYFKNVFVPNDLGNAQIVEVKDNPEGQKILQEKGEKSRLKMMRYSNGQINIYASSITATVKWDSGKEALVLCGVVIIEGIDRNNYNGNIEKTYVTTAMEKVVLKYPKGEKERASSILSVIMPSFRTNTEYKNTVEKFWDNVSEQSWKTHYGKLRMMDAETERMGREIISKGQQNLNNMDANMRSWEAKQASQDRMHTSFIKTIREVENYSDATGKVELSSGYNHAWSRSDGSSFIMSDNPNFDPSSVFQDQQWKEMRKVE